MDKDKGQIVMGHPRPTYYCPKCKKRNKKVIFFIRKKDGKNWRCNKCDNYFTKEELIPNNPKLAKRKND